MRESRYKAYVLISNLLKVFFYDDVIGQILYLTDYFNLLVNYSGT